MSRNPVRGNSRICYWKLSYRYGDWGSILISAFHWSSLAQVRKQDSRIALAVLAAPHAPTGEVLTLASRLRAFSIHPAVEDILSSDENLSDSYKEFPGAIYPHTVQAADSLLKVRQSIYLFNAIYPYTVQAVDRADAVLKRGFRVVLLIFPSHLKKD